MRSMIRNHEQYVLHQTLIISSSRKLSREVGMLRSTRGYEYSWKRFGSSTNLVISLANLRTEGIENNRSEEPLQSIGSRDRSNQFSKELINPKSITGKDFSDDKELDLMMAAELEWCYDIACLNSEITERRAVTRQKRANKSHTERRTEDCFQWKTNGSCLRRDACSFLHTHATGDREDNVG